MRIGFIDLGQLDYTPATPFRQPLGGMESSLSYLSAALIARGHDVTLVNRTSTPGRHEGVICRSLEQGLNPDFLSQFDVVVSIASEGVKLRNLGVACPLVLWTGHDNDVDSIQNLLDPVEQAAWDYIVLKSNWQVDRYITKFHIAPSKIRISKNAISPWVERTSPRTSFFFETGRPPVLIYSSTPSRGLVPLVEAFPRIRNSFPGCTLRVYSSMAVYQKMFSENAHQDLYERCKAIDGIEYFGSVGQADLAAALSECDILTYPNIFSETSCITLMEAMASGCLVVSNARGALPETAAGFGHLCKYPPGCSNAEFISIYADFAVQAISNALNAPAASRKKLEEQMRFAREHYIWPSHALRWEKFLGGLVAKAQAYDADRAVVKTSEILDCAVTGLDGKRIYVDPTDERGRRLVEAGGNFNPLTLAIWHELLDEDEWTHIVDVGANYGEMLANGKLRSGAQVIAIEPNARVLPFLKKTLSNIENVKLLNVAMSDREGHAEFDVNENWSGMSRIVPPGSGKPMVPTTTLACLLGMDGAPQDKIRALLKIDVEGHEVQCLKGMGDVLEKLRNFAALIEIAHMREEDLEWIRENFDMYAFHEQSRSLQIVEGLDVAEFPLRGFYNKDVVIRRKSGNPPDS